MIGQTISHYKILEKLGEGGSPREITKRQHCGSFGTIILARENEEYKNSLSHGVNGRRND